MTENVKNYSTKVHPSEDYFPSLILGLFSFLGTAYWLTTFFLYVKTSPSDASLPALPIAWLWSNLNHTSRGWMAASYFSTFIAYLVVSVVEGVSFVLYLCGEPMIMELLE